MCGDNWFSLDFLGLGRGSPPRVWGQLALGCCDRYRIRFTPTCVGTTRVLPHKQTTVGGSPPRVWGQHAARPLANCGSRFTPTCVGTTAFRPCLMTIVAVHPHVCGDNGFPPSTVIGYLGSPPRVWGQLDQLLLSILNDRFTPTCVGTTQRFVIAIFGVAVHPHVCGDNCA